MDQKRTRNRRSKKQGSSWTARSKRLRASTRRTGSTSDSEIDDPLQSVLPSSVETPSIHAPHPPRALTPPRRGAFIADQQSSTDLIASVII